MRRTNSGRRQTFDFGGTHRSVVSTLHGQRDSLFRPAMEIDTSVLDGISVDLEYAISKRLYALAVTARDMARRSAPRRTGSLRASIYATAPANMSELKALRKGATLKQGQMKGHSSGYAKAIRAAAERTAKHQMGADYIAGSGYVPGHDVRDDEFSFVTPRTQRLKIGKNATSLSDLMEEAGFDSAFREAEGLTGSFAGALAGLLPFSELGKSGRSSLYVSIGAAMYYAAWVEFGTSRQKSQPFFTPAADWLVAHAPGEIARAMKELG